MEKQRKIKVLAIAALIITILGLTVAFAALSQTLTINGAATLDAAKWGIKFENLSDGKTSGDAIINDTAVIADDLVTINNIDVSLSTPGDSVTYTVDLVNEGTINAEIYSIETPTLTEEQERYLNFIVTYDDGQEVKQGDILEQSSRKNITIKIEFDKDITDTDLPKEAQEISLSYGLTFVQTDKTSSTQPGTPSEDVKAMFNWEGDTVITSLTDYGIEEVKANNGHLVIPEGVTEIKGTSMEEVQKTGTLTTGFSPIAIGKIDISSGISEEILGNPEINIIKSVSFPSTLKTIGELAFAYCANLTSISLSSNIKEIGDYAFGMTQISGELIIPDNVTTIGDYAFSSTSITSLKLGNNVKIIGGYTFENCKNLTGELIIPDSVTTIGDYAFRGCGLTGELVIPNSVTTIGDYAFNSTSITSLKLGNNVKIIGDCTFENCKNLTGELIIPDSVTSIGNSAFSSTSITSLKLGHNVKEIGNSAFSSCNNLEGELIIPDSVTSIGDYAFRSTSITSLKLGNSVEKIGISAFQSCDLTGELIIPDSVTTIGISAFSSTPITSLKLGHNVKEIGTSAFAACNNLEGELYIPDSVTVIGDSAFTATAVNKITSISISKNTKYGYSFNGRPTPTIRD
ncbi:MAG TPA: leucine-rich repeat domain-containing protein [Candidatus Aphodocola excrementigallinarum]|uniref:Leucine-rich repeat domain-containing protein n=1 Tax=Candidatus Aphodocola excrementigallinarum TaxID=2840670 RepID=A0A9D1ILS9_9FIRM|nr:leucine-rich repeat domain-containing protein [Candidatus Aphodocola excrementigallinarum]